MSDDDRTIDADGATMADLRRMAAEIRESAAAGTPEEATTQASSADMEDLRRFATEAKQQNAEPSPEPSTQNRTVAADATTMADLKKIAAEVRASEAKEPSSFATPAVEPMPNWSPIREEQQFVDRGADSHRSLPVNQTELPEAMGLAAPTGRSVDGASWRPPDRTVMPTEPERRSEPAAGPWKKLTMLLAAALIVFMLLWFTGVIGGASDSPSDEPIPSEEIDGGVDGEQLDE